MYKPLITLLVTSLLCWGPSVVSAATLPAQDKLSSQRHLYVEAQRALNKRQIARFHKITRELRDYPLYPYLVYAELSRRLGRAKAAEINHFLTRYKQTPLVPQLQFRWLKQLARHKKWQLFIEQYQPSENMELRCAYGRALYETGEMDRAHAVTEGLWLTGKSLPRSCDAALRHWKRQDKLSNELVWKRINLAMQARQTRLARYLGKSLVEKEKFWLALWFKLRRNPEFIEKAEPRFHATNKKLMRWIIADSLPRLAKKQPEKAYALWQDYASRYPFTTRETTRIERHFILYAPEESNIARQILVKKARYQQLENSLIAERAFSAMLEHNWDEALQNLDNLPKGLQHAPRWIYWRGRTLEALGRLEEARATYLLNTESRNYYSFLAADRAGNNYHLSHRPIDFEDKQLHSLNKNPAFVRARELFILGESVDARREWNLATRSMNKAELLKAALLANQWHWYDRAISALAMARYWDDLELRFPLAHQKVVLSQASHRNISPAWAFAVIRQESAFISDARSHAGAMGLMQLMPSTARQVARNLKIRMRDKRDLLNVKTNIRLGVGYLKKVSERFNGHKVLATAAYNAGSHRVKQWLPDENQDADLWIETVPFSETREYMKRVLTYTAIYEQRLGLEQVPLTLRMQPVSKIPSLSQNRSSSGPNNNNS